MDETEIDALLGDLVIPSAASKALGLQPMPSITPKNDEDMNDYVIKKTSELVEMSLETVRDYKDVVVQGQNPEEMASLAELFSASTRAIEALNKLNMQAKKLKFDKEQKQLDRENKKEIIGLANTQQGPTNIIIASREEIMKQLTDSAKRLKDIDVDVEITTLEP